MSRAPQSDGSGLDASDLLDDNGKVDVSAIHSLTTPGEQAAGRVDADEATEIRQRLLRGATISELAQDLGRARSTIRNNAHGRVRYAVEPNCPPVAYHDGQWQVVDGE